MRCLWALTPVAAFAADGERLGTSVAGCHPAPGVRDHLWVERLQHKIGSTPFFSLQTRLHHLVRWALQRVADVSRTAASNLAIIILRSAYAEPRGATETLSAKPQRWRCTAFFVHDR
jgi:hypothetical protein